MKVPSEVKSPSVESKILLALDGSEPSIRAVQYVADMLGHAPDVSVTLFHVFPPMPSLLAETASSEGPIAPSEDEFERRRKSWKQNRDEVQSQLFQPARERFMQAGFGDEQIQTKCVTQHIDSDYVAHEILAECEKSGYDTIVMGKRGLSRIRTFLTGSVTEKVVRHAKGHAVWVIE